VQGPCLARGYLSDEARTKASFLNSPAWLPPDSTYQRVYKSGDLVRYSDNGDGTLESIGHRDDQMKLRGQRLEPGEIEHHIKLHLGSQSLPSVQVVKVVSSSTLIAFISVTGKTAPNEKNAIVSPLDEDTAQNLRGLDEDLRSVLPTYKVPSYYLPVAHMPLNASGKINGKALRQWAVDLSPEELAKYSPTDQAVFQPPVTPIEMVLQKLWAGVLRYPPDAISRNSSFLQLGGDSVSAIHLLAAAREENISLTVSPYSSGATVEGRCSIG
jgi:aryl carrier-like protein